ncbi:phage holin family protein [Ureibacillus composti]|nr:phage holin family protein [Ureibacillus composti]
MEFDLFASFIDTRSYVLIPVLYIIIFLLRQTPHIPTWTHAWIAMGISVVSCLFYYGFMIQSFVEGVLVTGVAILTKDLIHVNVSTGRTKKEDNTK